MDKLLYSAPYTEKCDFILKNTILENSADDGLNVGIDDWDRDDLDFGGEV